MLQYQNDYQPDHGYLNQQLQSTQRKSVGLRIRHIPYKYVFYIAFTIMYYAKLPITLVMIEYNSEQVFQPNDLCYIHVLHELEAAKLNCTQLISSFAWIRRLRAGKIVEGMRPLLRIKCVMLAFQSTEAVFTNLQSSSKFRNPVCKSESQEKRPFLQNVQVRSKKQISFDIYSC